MAEPSLCVALTGGTGFVGRHVLQHLLNRNHRVRALVRDPDRLTVKDSNVHPIAGDLFNRSALAQLVRGADAVVHIVGIIMEKPRQGQTFDRVHRVATLNLLGAAGDAHVKRWVHMSALGTRPDAVSTYHRTKWAAEQAIRDSGLDYTIFRPSMIHGPDGEFMQMVRGFWCNRLPPFVPYFGAGLLGRGGAGKLQPVWVQDVARCFAGALTNSKSVGETYPIGGPDVYTWPQFYETCRRHLPRARNKRIMAVPVWYASLIAGKPGVPFNRDQVIMSQEDSVCGIEKVQTDFDVELASFEPTFAEYAASI
ncbi:MAG: NAD(P)H-binding protein [Phycisphaeraceae bacterium]